MDLIQVRDLAVGYEHKSIIDKLNFTIKQGDYLCIVGENGAGKSTLIKTLLNLIKPIAGDLKLNGIKHNEIGYLPQQSLAQRNFPASVYEIVLSGNIGKSRLWPFYNKKDKEQALKALKILGITDLKNRSYKELSGGQQQRVLLARALCATQKIIMLDEPTTALDPRSTHQLYQIIESLNHNEHITIVMISHDLQMAIKYASHILYVGKKNFFGSKDDFIKTTLYQNLQGL